MPISMPGGGIHAGLYGRISLARFGETIKTEDQLALCENLAVQRDWTVTRRYADPNKSAWKRDRVRPAWDQMLKDVEAGVINAIVVYHGDRLIRQPWDLELLLRLADEKGIRLASPTGERNLDSPDDRFILRIEAAGACRESDNTSRRLKWHYDKAAQRGVVRLGGRGGRAFGFEPDGMTVRKDDEKTIQEVARRIIAGEPIGAIARDITARGSRTTAGNEWTYANLRRLMGRARLAGLVSHNGEIIGKAAWPAILERDQWETVCAILDRKAETFAHITNAKRYLLSGIAKCGTCGSGLVVRHNVRPHLLGYGCVNPPCAHKVHRQLRHLDKYVIGYMLKFLSHAETRDRLTPGATVDWNERLQELKETRQRRIDEFAEDDEAESDIIKAMVRRYDRQIAEVRTKMAVAAAPHVLDGAWGIDEAGWERFSLDRRRAMIAYVVDIIVLPGRRGPGFDPAYVQLTKREPVR
jgi:site-specific DNA recombinase